MNLTELHLLTDENINPDVVKWLRESGFDVLDVCECGLHGTTDSRLLQMSVEQSLVIVTHDSDFGTLAMQAGAAVFGILFLRPGHIDPLFTIGTIGVVLNKVADVQAPFVVAARRTGVSVTVRVRHLSTE